MWSWATTTTTTTAGGLLHALTLANQWRVAVLVDEAHNLVERARSMYSAELEQGALRALRRSAAPVSPPLKRALDRLNRHWNALQREQRTPYAASDACRTPSSRR
jgi:DNA excision repair protein ERCC-2